MSAASQAILADLEFNRKRLAYFESQVAKYLAQPPVGRKQPKAPDSVTQWVEIYSERVRKLERKIQRQGLRTELKPATAAKRSARA